MSCCFGPQQAATQPMNYDEPEERETLVHNRHFFRCAFFTRKKKYDKWWARYVSDDAAIYMCHWMKGFSASTGYSFFVYYNDIEMHSEKKNWEELTWKCSGQVAYLSQFRFVVVTIVFIYDRIGFRWLCIASRRRIRKGVGGFKTYFPPFLSSIFQQFCMLYCTCAKTAKSSNLIMTFRSAIVVATIQSVIVSLSSILHLFFPLCYSSGFFVVNVQG